MSTEEVEGQLRLPGMPVVGECLLCGPDCDADEAEEALARRNEAAESARRAMQQRFERRA